MAYQYYLKSGKILPGSTFHSISTLQLKNSSLEKPLHLGNFYHTINLKAKTSVMKRILDNNDLSITVWEE